MQNRARKDLEHKQPAKTNVCAFWSGAEKLFHKRRNERDGEFERGTNPSWIIGFVLCDCSTWPPSLQLQHTINAALAVILVTLSPLFIWKESLVGLGICRWACLSPDCWGTRGDCCPERESHQCELGGGVTASGLILRRPGCWGRLITWVSSCRDTWTLKPRVSLENNC